MQREIGEDIRVDHGPYKILCIASTPNANDDHNVSLLVDQTIL